MAQYLKPAAEGRRAAPGTLPAELALAPAQRLKRSTFREKAPRRLCFPAQVGALQIDEGGLARRGVLVRHLVMPGCLDETEAILDWLATTLGTDTYVNLMDQYRPAGKVAGGRFAAIDRPLLREEMHTARRLAADAGLHRLDR